MIELLVVIAIIGLLAGLAAPVMGKVREKAWDARCVNNLRQLGVLINAYTQDHEGRLPAIDPLKNSPVDPEHPLPSLAEALGPYGATPEVLKCPLDAARGEKARFPVEGGSYEYNWGFKEDPVPNPSYYHWSVPLKRAWLLADYDSVHRGRTGSTKNVLYADGKVVALP